MEDAFPRALFRRIIISATDSVAPLFAAHFGKRWRQSAKRRAGASSNASQRPTAQTQEPVAAAPEVAKQPAIQSFSGGDLPRTRRRLLPSEADPSDQISRPAHGSAETSSSPEEQADEDNYLTRCVTDIAEQLKSVPAKNFPAVSPIVLGGCKLLIATWEAQAFVQDDDTSKALQRTVAARTILHVCVERHKKNEPTDLAAAMDIARVQVEEMKQHVEAAKEAKNIDAAVNLAATSKRLLSLIAECEKAG